MNTDTTPRTPKSVILTVTATLCGSLLLMMVALAFCMAWQTVHGWNPDWNIQQLAKDVTLILIGAVGGILSSPRVRPDDEPGTTSTQTTQTTTDTKGTTP